MQITHALIAVKLVNNQPVILHFCGYEHSPSQTDIDFLRAELAIDSEFGLVGRDDFVIMEAPPEVIEFYKYQNRNFEEFLDL